MTLTAGAAYTVGTPSAATVTLADNETITSTPTLTLCSGSVAPPSCSFLASPNRVRKGNAANLSWNVSGLIVQNTCSITASPSSGLASPLSWDGVGTTWVGGPTATAALQSRTVFTLRCLAPDGTTAVETTQTVNIIPEYMEI